MTFMWNLPIADNKKYLARQYVGLSIFFETIWTSRASNEQKAR